MPCFSSIKHLMEFVPNDGSSAFSAFCSYSCPWTEGKSKSMSTRKHNTQWSKRHKVFSGSTNWKDGSETKQSLVTNLKFWNSTFDKGRLKNFVSWFLKNYGERKTIELLEQFKNLGFGYATQAGVSLGIDDLLIPPEKMKFLSVSNKTVFQSNSKYKNAKITAVEKIQLFIDTWNETSENLKKEVVRYFEKTNIFNPVYMMAFSGARGNISQVRQLVGMRGLMSDPQGNIIDFPIQSNFREGLTLTEYIISTYGARKGIVDTALRTATAGYLTRRLVDVAQHVMISLFDCKTNRGIFVFDVKEGNQTLSSFQSRLVGRVLANDMFVTDTGTKSICIGYRNQEISNELAIKMAQLAKKAFVRSPLTCQSSKFVCQLCYGWSLSRNKLVSLGEAVGVIAGQSIGEPGTQLTMRTFHTGGVFSGGLTESVVANYDGWIEYLEPIPGTCIRTLQGKIAFLTKAESSFLLKQKTTFSEMVPSNKGTIGTSKGTNNLGFHKIPGYAILFARHKQFILKKQILAQFSSGNQFKTQKGNAEQTVYADLEGEIFFNQIDLLEQKSNYFMQDTLWKSYYKSKIWILAGKIYQNKFFGKASARMGHTNKSQSGKSTNFLVQNKDFVNKKSVFERVSWQSSNQNIIEFSNGSKAPPNSQFIQQTIVSSIKNNSNLENFNSYIQRNAEESKLDLRKTYLINKFFLFNTFKNKNFQKMKNPSQLKSGLQAWKGLTPPLSEQLNRFSITKQRKELNYSCSKTLYKFLLKYQKIKTKDFYSLGFSQNLKLQIPSIYLYNNKFRSIFKRKYNLMDLSKKLTNKSFLTYFNKKTQSKIRFSAGAEQTNAKMNQTDFSIPEQTNIIEFNLRQIKQKNMKFLANYKNQETYIPNFLKKSPLKVLEKNPVWISKSFSYKTNLNFNSKIVKFSINKNNKLAQGNSVTKRKFLLSNLLTKKFLTNKLDKTSSLEHSSTLEKIFYIYETNFSNCSVTPFSSGHNQRERAWSGINFMPLGKGHKTIDGQSSAQASALALGPSRAEAKTLSMQVMLKNKFFSGNFSKQNSSSILKVSNLPNHKLLKTPLLFVSLNKIVFQSRGYIFEISDSKPSLQKKEKELFRKTLFWNSRKKYQNQAKLGYQTENYKILSFFPLNQTDFSGLSSSSQEFQRNSRSGTNSCSTDKGTPGPELINRNRLVPRTKNALKKPYLNKVISPYNNENIKPNPSTIFHWFPEKEKTQSGLFISFKSNKKWNFQNNFWIQKKRFQKTNYIHNSSIFTRNSSLDNLKKLKQSHFRKLSRYKKFSLWQPTSSDNGTTSSELVEHSLYQVSQTKVKSLNSMKEECDHPEEYQNSLSSDAEESKDFQNSNFKKFSVSTEKFYWIPQQNYNFSSNFEEITGPGNKGRISSPYYPQTTVQTYFEKSSFRKPYSNVTSAPLIKGKEGMNYKNFYLVNRQGKKKQVQFQISGLTLVQENFFPYAKLNYNKSNIWNQKLDLKKQSKKAQEGTKVLKSKVLSNHYQNKFFVSSNFEEITSPGNKKSKSLSRTSLLKKTNKQILKFQLNKKFNSFLLDSELKNLLLKNLKKKFFSLEDKVLSSTTLKNQNISKDLFLTQNQYYGSLDPLSLSGYEAEANEKGEGDPHSEHVNLTNSGKKQNFSDNSAITQLAGLCLSCARDSLTNKSPTFSQFFTLFPYSKKYKNKVFSQPNLLTKKNLESSFYSKNLNITMKPGWVYVFSKKNCTTELFSLHQTFFKSGYNFLHDINFEQHPVYIENCICKDFSEYFYVSSGRSARNESIPGNIVLKRFSKKMKNQNCRYIVTKASLSQDENPRWGNNLALLIRPIYSKIIPNSSFSKTILLELNKNLNNIKSSSFLIKDYHSNLLNKQSVSQKTFLSGCYLDFEINQISPLLNLQKKPLWFHSNRLKTENQENTEFDHQSPLSLFEFLPIPLDNNNSLQNKVEPSNLHTLPMLQNEGLGQGQSKIDQKKGEDKAEVFLFQEGDGEVENDANAWLNQSEAWLAYAGSANQKQKTLLKNTIKKNFLELISRLVLKTDAFQSCLGSSYETYYSYKPFYSNSFQSSWKSGVRRTGFQNFDSQATPMVQISSKPEIFENAAKCFLINNIYPLPFLKWFLVQKTAYLGNQRFAGVNLGQDLTSSNNISRSLNNKNFQRSFSKNSFLFYRFNLVLKNQTFANTDILSPFQGEFIESKKSKNTWWNQESETFLIGKEEKIKHEIFLTKKDMFCVLFPKFNNVFTPSSPLSVNSSVNPAPYPDKNGTVRFGASKSLSSFHFFTEWKQKKEKGKSRSFRKSKFKKIVQLQFFLNLRPNNFKPVILYFDNLSSNSLFFKKMIMDQNKFDFISGSLRSQASFAKFSFPLLSGGNGTGGHNIFHNYSLKDRNMEQTDLSKKQKPYISTLIKICKKNIPLIEKPEFLDQFLSEAKDKIYKIDNFLTKYQKRLYRLKGLSVGKSNKVIDLRLGTFLFKGDLINSFTSFHKTGQILHLNSKKITLRYAQPFLVSAKGILHVHQGDPIFKNVPVITLPFDTFTTGDIVQGIPKVEQYLEARTTQNGRFFVYSLPVLLQGIFKRYCNKFPLNQAVSQSFLKIQLIIVDGVQRVYGSQGVSIADKHLEVIVKQMTSKVQIVHGGQTGFFPGELVDLEIIERINPFLMVKIQYEPVVLGITRASLEAESFLSAASFQQTTKILAKSSLYKKKDFLKGLKENILIGNLIPAGTGYMNIL